MRPKSMVLILVALGCGLVASIGISQVMENRAGQGIVEAMETQEIYVTMGDIAVGTPLTPQLVKLEEWPRDRVPVGAITKLEELEGKMPKTPLFAGEPLMAAKLASDLGGTGERIPSGYRVMSVKVSMDTGVSGLILPGDRVDILVFLKRSGEISKTGTRTILRDVRIFAIGSQINREAGEDGKVGNYKTVSVLVKPEQVEKLMLASELGSLRLSLRRADDDVDQRTTGATVADLADTEKGSGSQQSSDPQSQDDSSQSDDSSGGILGMLKLMQESSAAQDDTMTSSVVAVAAPPKFTMIMHSPDGIQSFNWDDVRQLPRELGPGDVGQAGLAPPAQAAPPTPPTPAAPAAEPTIDEILGGTSEPSEPLEDPLRVQ